MARGCVDSRSVVPNAERNAPYTTSIAGQRQAAHTGAFSIRHDGRDFLHGQKGPFAA